MTTSPSLLDLTSREPNRSATPPLPSLPFQTKEITSPFVSDDGIPMVSC